MPDVKGDKEGRCESQSLHRSAAYVRKHQDCHVNAKRKLTIFSTAHVLGVPVTAVRGVTVGLTMWGELWVQEGMGVSSHVRVYGRC